MRSITSLLFCLLSLLALATTRVRTLGIDDGLSNNLVNAVYQDRNGFIWIGTYDGLNRYDGYRFSAFRNQPFSSASLPDNNIFQIAEDDNGNFWIGSEKGFTFFNAVTSQFSRLKYRPYNNSKSNIIIKEGVSSILRIPGNGVLAGTSRSGLMFFQDQYTPGEQIPVGKNGKTPKTISALAYAERNKLVWVFVQGEGLFQYDIKNKTLSLVNNIVKQANSLAVKGEALWISSDNGLFQFEKSGRVLLKKYHFTPSKLIKLLIDKDEVLWIGTDGDGVWQLYPNTTIARRFIQDEEGSLTSNAISSLMEAADGRIWIGTNRGGVNVIDKAGQPFFLHRYSTSHTNSPAANFILSFCEDRKNNVWIGTDGAGLRYWDRKADTYTNYVFQENNPNGLSSKFIPSIAEDISGDIWIGTWGGGINRMSVKTQKIKQYKCINQAGQLEQNIWVVYCDRENQVWASATNEGHLYKFDRTQDKFVLFDPSLVDIQTLYEDKAGNLWAGNYNDLILIDKSSRKHVFFHLDVTVRNIYQDRENRMWIGTQSKGLLLFDAAKGVLQQFTQNDGLPNNTVLRILADEKDALWLSTFNGLSKFNYESKTFQNFFVQDGLQSNQFSFNAGIRLRSNELIFGGINGFNTFRPSDIRPNESSSSIFLNAIYVNSEPIYNNFSYVKEVADNQIKKIVIPYDKAILALEFVHPTFQARNTLHYAYFMEGLDKKWTYSQSVRTANYTRLPEGNYRFFVKMKTISGRWGKEILLLEAKVLPPWYRAWWAYILYIGAATLIIYYLLLYYRKRQQLKFEVRLAQVNIEKERELNEKKLDFFSNVSHEFRTPLSLIINPLENLVARLEGQDHIRDIAETAFRNSKRLLSLVNQLLLFRTAEHDLPGMQFQDTDIAALCQEIFDLFIVQSQAGHINYKFHTTSADGHYYAFADKEKLEIALFNMLSNAFKFTEADGEIALVLEMGKDEYSISVIDNGSGIPTSDQELIFEKYRRNTNSKTGFGIGLYLVKKIAEAHTGRVEIRSVAGKGSRFTIYIPNINVQDSKKEPFVHEGLIKDLVHVVPPPNEREYATPIAEQNVEQYVSDKKKLLIVDDDKDLLLYLETTFKDGFLVFTAQTGQAALNLVETVLPDIIVSDLKMDNMSGTELCEQIKQKPKWAHIPFILLTGSTTADNEISGIEKGADAYITKPFKIELLRTTIQSILKNRGRLKQYYLESITLKESAVEVPEEYREFLEKCITVVEAHIDTEGFNNQMFAKAMHMSRSRLYEKVKAISGQSLNSFIRSIRLRRAAVLLLTENLTISQVAFMVGFEDVRYFREQFTKLFNLTPSSYLKQFRGTFQNKINKVKKPK